MSLLYCRVCSLQPCDHLLGKSWPLGSIVCDDSLCFVTFPYGVSGQVWCLIASIPDICLLLYFCYLCCMVFFNMLPFLFLVALWSAAGKGLTSWSCCVLCFVTFPWYSVPLSSVLLYIATNFCYRATYCCYRRVKYFNTLAANCNLMSYVCCIIRLLCRLLVHLNVFVSNSVDIGAVWSGSVLVLKISIKMQQTDKERIDFH